MINDRIAMIPFTYAQELALNAVRECGENTGMPYGYSAHALMYSEAITAGSAAQTASAFALECKAWLIEKHGQAWYDGYLARRMSAT